MSSLDGRIDNQRLCRGGLKSIPTENKTKKGIPFRLDKRPIRRTQFQLKHSLIKDGAKD